LQLYVRRKFFNPPTRLSSYYKKVVDNVRAESQAEACMLLENSKFLSDEELNILRWGKNATGILPKRFNHGSGSREIYRNATAIECLVSDSCIDVGKTTLQEISYLFNSSDFLLAVWLLVSYKLETLK